MKTPLALNKAILMWKRGQRIPLTLTTELLSLGLCVETLERRYCA